MEENRMILAGEIGGTHARLAAFETEGSKLNCVIDTVFESQQHSGLAEIVAEFVKTNGVPVDSACFGVAGPVRHGRCKISNLSWIIDSRELAKQLRLHSVGLLNDLEAFAYGIDALGDEDFITLNEGSQDAEGNRAVVSARTGLGVAGLYWDGRRHHPFACEGGHTNFAPRNEVEDELLRYLRTKYTRVSYERIASGPGIKNIYDFLRETRRAEEPDWLQEQIRNAPDAPAAISLLAAEGKAPICDQALSLFVSVYGAHAGDCALTFMTTGGLFIGGSIAAKNLPKMREPAFMESFLDKGRMAELLQDMPVKVVLNDDAGILGAARYTLIQKAFDRASRSAV
jgi:glucokinase